MKPKYPALRVDAALERGALFAAVMQTMRFANVSPKEIARFRKEAVQSDGQAGALDVARRWVTISDRPNLDDGYEVA